MKMSFCFLISGSAALLVSCASYTAKTQAKSGGDFLLRLHHRGELPGDSKDNHGKITCRLSPSDLEQVSYPLSWTYQVVKTGDTSTNSYTVMRLTRHSAWQLQRAWRTDSQGHVIEEWTVK